MKLTTRGAVVALTGIFAATWLASAVGYWLTKVPG